MGKNAIDAYKAFSQIEIALPGENEDLQELASRACNILNDFKERNPDIDPMEVGGYRIYLQVIGSLVKPLGEGEPSPEAILNAWRVYSYFCYKFEHIPTRIDFEISTGRKIRWDKWFVEKSERGKVLQGIYAEMDGAMMQHATEHNSVGGIYASKALYGHNDSQPSLTIINNNVNEKASDIAAKYGMIFDGKAEEIKKRDEIDGISEDVRVAESD